ncbi:g10289 [Coccomyxa elongata]
MLPVQQPARGLASHAIVAALRERSREPTWQGADDDQAIQHAIPESSSGSNAARPVPQGGLGLRLKKSASLLEWLNKKLAEQGQQTDGQPGSCSAFDLSQYSVDDGSGGSDGTKASLETVYSAGTIERLSPQQDTGSGPDAASSCMSGTGLQAQWRYLFSEADSASEPATPRSNGCPPGHSQEQRGLPTDNSGPLPGSQSHIDLESFAASILLEDHMGHHIDQPLSMDLTGNNDVLLGFEEHSDSVAACSIHTQQAPPQQQHFSLYGDWALHQTALMCGSPRTVQSNSCQQGAELAYACNTAAPDGEPMAAAESFNAFLLDTGDFQSGSLGLSNPLEDSARTQLSRTVSLPPNANRHTGHLSFHYSEPCSPAADRGLLRTESMPARELASPRGRTGRSRTAADLLKPGPAGVAKTLGSPRPIMRLASEIPHGHLLAEAYMSAMN